MTTRTAVRVLAGDLVDRGPDTGHVLVAGLSIRPDAVRVSLGDLAVEQARPGADVDLAQARIGDHWDAVRRGDDLGRLVGAPRSDQ